MNAIFGKMSRVILELEFIKLLNGDKLIEAVENRISSAVGAATLHGLWNATP
jgi:hypothetical protein